jgi:hypothetical protein
VRTMSMYSGLTALSTTETIWFYSVRVDQYLMEHINNNPTAEGGVVQS